jgi:hypothetical protein
VQVRTELEAAQQLVQAQREEKAQTALAHQKSLRALRDKLDEEVLERERLQGALESSASVLRAEREAATRARTTALAEQSQVVLRAELLAKEVGDKQSKLLSADRALNTAAEKALALERDLSRASEAHQAAVRECENAGGARRRAEAEAEAGYIRVANVLLMCC